MTEVIFHEELPASGLIPDQNVGAQDFTIMTTKAINFCRELEHLFRDNDRCRCREPLMAKSFRRNLITSSSAIFGSIGVMDLTETRKKDLQRMHRSSLFHYL